MPTAPYNPRRRDEDDDLPSPTDVAEIEVDFDEPAASAPRTVLQRPQAPDAFAPGGIPDAPNLQTRRAVTKAVTGQRMEPRDYRNIAVRQGIESSPVLQQGGEGMDAPDLQVRTAAIKAQLGAPMSNREIDRLNTRQALEAQQGNLPPERSVSTLLTGSRLDPRGTRAEQAAEARRLATEQKQAARAQEIQARREFNSKALADYKAKGIRYYTDPADGRIKPVVDEKNRVLHFRSDWEPGEDPQGRPAKVMRDEFGQRQFKRPPLVMSPDAKDEYLYADMGDGESKPYMTLEEAAASGDFSLKRTALSALARRNTALRRERVAPVKQAYDAANAEYEAAKGALAAMEMEVQREQDALGQIDPAALKETEGGFLGIGGKPTAKAQQAQQAEAATRGRMQQIETERARLEQAVGPRGTLTLARTIAQADLRLAAAQAARDAYADQESQIMARLEFARKDPATDPTFQANRAALEAADKAVKAAEGTRKRFDEVLRGTPPATEAKPAAQPESPSTVAEGAKSFARGALSEGFYAAAEGGARMVQNVEAALKEERGGPQAALSALIKERDALSGGQRTLGGAKRGRRTTPEEAARLKQLEQIEIPYARTMVMEDKRRRLEGTVGGWYADQVAQTRDIIRKALPVDQEFAESTLGQLAQGAGQLAGTLPLAFTGAAGPAALAGASFGQIYQEGYDDAIAGGASPAYAHRAAVQYLPAGAIDALSNQTMVGKALKRLVGKATVRQIGEDILKTAGMEGVTEGTQQGYLNTVASVLEGYDPEREFDEEVLQSVLIGALLGGGITTVSQGMQRALGKDEGTLPPPEDTGRPSTDVPPPTPGPITAADAVPVQPTPDEANARLQAEAANDPELAALLAESEPVATAPVEAPAGEPAPVAEVAPAAVEPVAAPVADEPAQAPEPAPAVESPAPVAEAEPAVVAAEAAPTPSPEPPVATTEITPEAEGAGAPAQAAPTAAEIAALSPEEFGARYRSREEGAPGLTEEAMSLGRATTTDEGIAELAARRDQAREDFAMLRNAGDIQGATDAAAKSQFFSEALQEAEKNRYGGMPPEEPSAETMPPTPRENPPDTPVAKTTAEARIKTLLAAIEKNREPAPTTVSKQGQGMIRSVRSDTRKRLAKEVREIQGQLADIKAGRPVSAAFVEAYGIKIPEGYVLEGEGWKGRYVRSDAQPTQAPDTPVATEQSGMPPEEPKAEPRLISPEELMALQPKPQPSETVARMEREEADYAAQKSGAKPDYDAEETNSGTTYQYRLAKEDGKWTAQIRIKGGSEQWEGGVGVGKHSTRKAAAERFAARFPDAALSASDPEIKAIAESAKAERDQRAAAEAKQKAEAAETNRIAAEKRAAYMAEVRAVPLKGKSQEIKLSRKNADGSREQVPTQAMVYGDWAIHKIIEGKKTTYAVTHVPSGLRAQIRDTLAQAKEMVQAFAHAGIDASSPELASDKKAMRQLAEVAMALRTDRAPSWFGEQEGGAQPAVAPTEPPPTPAPSQMKAPALRAELAAAGIQSVSGVPLEDANAAQLMAAVGKLRRGQLESAAPLTTDKLLKRLESAKKRKTDELRGKAFAATEGVYRAAEIAALDIAILAVRAGRPIEQAVRMAIARFKARYPTATPEELSQAEASIRGALNEPPPPPKPTAPKDGDKRTSRVGPSMRNRGVPIEDMEYDARAQEARMEEAQTLVTTQGAEKAEAAIENPDIAPDTRVAIGGTLIRDKMLDIANAKPEDVANLTRDMNRIVRKMRPELATKAGQTVAMWGGIYRDIGVASGVEYLRDVQKKTDDAIGGKDGKEAIDAATAALDKDMTPAEINAEIERLKKQYSTKPARKVLTALQKQGERVERLRKLGALKREDLADLVGRELKIPTPDPAKLKRIAEIADRIKNAPTHAERSRAELDLADQLAIYKGVAAMDVLTSMMTAGVLSGYTTQMANLQGTALNMLANIGTTAIANPGKLKPIIEGLVRGVPLGVDQFKAIWKTGVGTRDLQDKTGGAGSPLARVDFERDYGVPGAAGKALTGSARISERVFRIMRAVDAVFYYPAREAYATLVATKLLEGNFKGAELAQKVRESLHVTPEAFMQARQQATTEGYTGVDLGRRVADIIEGKRQETLPQAAKESEQFAAESTFTNEPVGLAGVVYRATKNLVENMKVAGVPVIKPWLMFLKTPANVFNAITNYTPAGFVRSSYGMIGTAPGEKNRRNFTADERAQLKIKAVVGTTLMFTLLAGLMDDEDIEISGKGPSDFNKRRQLQDRGWIPYSIRIGGQYISYKDSPLLLPLAIVGNARDSVKYQRAKSELLLGNQYADAMLKAGTTIFDLSMLTGLGDLLEAMKDSNMKRVGRALSSVPANTAIPLNRLLQQIDQTFDQQSYEINPLIGSIPFARRTGIPRTDVLGRPSTYSPAQRFTSGQRETALDAVLREKSLFISEPSKETKVGNRVMTEDEYRKYREISGQRIRVRLESIVPRLRILTKEQAEKEIDRVEREERERAKRAVIIGAPTPKR